MRFKRCLAFGLLALAAAACAARGSSPSKAPAGPEEKAPESPAVAPGQPGYAAPPPGGGQAGLVPPSSTDESAAYATLADAERALDQADGELAGLTGKPKDKTSSS